MWEFGCPYPTAKQANFDLPPVRVRNANFSDGFVGGRRFCPFGLMRNGWATGLTSVCCKPVVGNMRAFRNQREQT